MIRFILALITVTLMGAGCSTSNVGGDGDIVETNGTIQYVEVEGGFYGIVADDGKQYDPMDLDEAYKEDGLRVHFRARTAEGVASIHMWGTLVEILAIERL